MPVKTKPVISLHLKGNVYLVNSEVAESEEEARTSFNSFRKNFFNEDAPSINLRLANGTNIAMPRQQIGECLLYCNFEPITV